MGKLCGMVGSGSDIMGAGGFFFFFKKLLSESAMAMAMAMAMIWMESMAHGYIYVIQAKMEMYAQSDRPTC